VLTKGSRYLYRKARENSYLRSLILPSVNRDFASFGSFQDSQGNTFPLLSGFRDALKPEWASMVNPDAALALPPQTQIQESAVTARVQVGELSCLLQSIGSGIAGNVILEVGCYLGAACYALAENGAREVWGSDVPAYYINQTPLAEFSETFITRARALLNEGRRKLGTLMNKHQAGSQTIRFVEDDICTCALPSNHFDLIVSWSMLEHVQDPSSFFAHTCRILKPGGVAFHDYGSIFSLTGGHSLCTLDFPWGQVRLDATDFERYLNEIRPAEAEVALRFYRLNLNRMTLKEATELAEQTGFAVIGIIPWPQKTHLDLFEDKILDQCTRIYPSATLVDLLSPSIWVLLKKPSQ